MILTANEIRELTGKQRSSAQVRELKAMGIPHRMRSDGSPVVLNDDLVSSKVQPSKKPRLRL